MDVQLFKPTDANEVKIDAVAEAVFSPTSLALDDMLAGAYNSSPFLLMLYDEGRMPYSARINREAFVAFIKEALSRFPVIGTFESYIFILKAVFGDLSEILFEVPVAGKLAIEVNAVSGLEFDFLGREYVDGAYEYFDIVTMGDEDTLTFRGLSGIDTEYELALLFSEMMPGGIVPDITLNIVDRSFFIGDDTDGEYFVIDDADDQIIFIEGSL